MIWLQKSYQGFIIFSKTLVYIPTLSLVDYVKSLNVPVICFPRGISNYKNYCEIVKPDVVSIDYDTDPKKIVKELIDGLPVSDDTTKELKNLDPEFLKLSKKDLAREIKKLEKEMLKNARELEFEKAALSRDKLEEAKAVLLDL